MAELEDLKKENLAIYGRMDELRREREELRREVDELRQRKLAGTIVCPSCHRSLPTRDQVQQLRFSGGEHLCWGREERCHRALLTRIPDLVELVGNMEMMVRRACVEAMRAAQLTMVDADRLNWMMRENIDAALTEKPLPWMKEERRR